MKMTPRSRNSEWVMAGRRTGKSKYTLLAKFMQERQHKRNTGDVVVYTDFLREEIESHDRNDLKEEEVKDIIEAIKYLSNKENLAHDKLTGADMPKLSKAEMVLFRLKSGDWSW